MSIPDIKYRPRIGLFDSGRGGFSILRALIDLHLDVDYIYIADHAFAPYGGKDDAQILQRSQVLCKSLIHQNVDAIVVACNTATAVAIDQLRTEFSLPIIGVEPFLTAAQKSVIPLEDRAQQVVLVTPSMFKSARFNDLRQRRDPEQQVRVHACPTMAGAIEQAFDHPRPPMMIQQALRDLASLKNQGLKYALLGCTHYPLIAAEIEDYLQVKTLSPCHFVANRVAQVLQLSLQVAPSPARIYYASSKDFIFQSLDERAVQLVARD
jgi:glutamate racemase